MTKCSEIVSLYNEIGKLLDDICNFLNEENKGGYLSPNGSFIAKNLIQRSKQQLQALSNVSPESSFESYVDMNSTKDNDYQNENEVYSDVSMIFDKSSNDSTNDEVFTTCPYENTSASSFVNGKFGYLHRKDKVLFFQQHKKFYIVIQQPWLLYYSAQCAIKPCQILDLTDWEAKGISKRDEIFDLVNIKDSTTHRFIAKTSKDMLQWVTAINKKSNQQQFQNRTLPPVPVDSSKNSNVSDINGSSETTNQITLKPPVNTNTREPSPNSFILPSITPRNTPSPKMIPNDTSPSLSEDSLASYDFVGPTNKTRSHSNSFSEDDSDILYDTPEFHKNEHQQSNGSNNSENKIMYDEDEEQIYDLVEEPTTNKKEVDPKLKLALKGKMFGFRSKSKDII